MSRYETLLEDYMRDLRAVRDEATEWWEGLLAKASCTDRDAAERCVRPIWPAGPVSHPRVLAVYRKYWLRADRINEVILKRWDERAAAREKLGQVWERSDEEAEEEGVVNPSLLLTENLIPHDSELYEFISDLVFQPVGLDYDGVFS